MKTKKTTARSMAAASARLGSRAGLSPRTTASPVTNSLIAPPLFPGLRCSGLPQSAKLTRNAPQ
ncbi:hypothetical protein GCM10010498_51800 [Streptomyces cavourensis]|nr:hypothetical protein GCM10010498_51800 [Streptomyces cavourensis]